MQVGGYCRWSVGRLEQIGELEDGQVEGGEILKLVKSILRPLGLKGAKDGHVTRGLGGAVKVDGNRKVGLDGACRAQLLRKAVPESAFSLPDIQETASRAMVTVDEGRSMGNVGDAVEGILNTRGGETRVLKVGGYLQSPRIERSILGADAAEAEEFGESVTGEEDGKVQEREGGARNGPGEFEGALEGVGEVDELFELLAGARGSTDTVINVAEKEVRDSAGVVVEKGLFHEFYKEGGIAWARVGAHGYSFGLLAVGGIKGKIVK
eukprot:g41200.t1